MKDIIQNNFNNYGLLSNFFNGLEDFKEQFKHRKFKDVNSIKQFCQDNSEKLEVAHFLFTESNRVSILNKQLNKLGIDVKSFIKSNEFGEIFRQFTKMLPKSLDQQISIDNVLPSDIDDSRLKSYFSDELEHDYNNDYDLFKKDLQLFFFFKELAQQSKIDDDEFNEFAKSCFSQMGIKSKLFSNKKWTDAISADIKNGLLTKDLSLSSPLVLDDDIIISNLRQDQKRWSRTAGEKVIESFGSESFGTGISEIIQQYLTLTTGGGKSYTIDKMFRGENSFLAEFTKKHQLKETQETFF